MKTSAFLSVAFAFALATPILAQTKFDKKFSDAEKLEKKAYWDFPRERGKNGGGYTAHYPTLGAVPKKVALVSFSYHDPGYTKSSKTQVSTVRTATGIAQVHIDKYTRVAIEPIKKAYAEYGMEVLTPDQFLDTEEKREFYNSFYFQKARSLNKLLTKVATGGTSVSLNLAATGYKEMVPKNEMVVMKGSSARNSLMDAKTKATLNALGNDLCKGLGVDAVIIVYNSHHTKKQITVDLDYVTMALMGPNPIQLGEDDKKPLVYRNGVYYAVARIKVGLPTTDKKNPSIATEGYANIMTGMSHKIGKWMVEKIAK
jgi:hypothetical protein